MNQRSNTEVAQKRDAREWNSAMMTQVKNGEKTKGLVTAIWGHVVRFVHEYVFLGARTSCQGGKLRIISRQSAGQRLALAIRVKAFLIRR